MGRMLGGWSYIPLSSVSLPAFFYVWKHFMNRV